MPSKHTVNSYDRAEMKESLPHILNHAHTFIYHTQKETGWKKNTPVDWCIFGNDVLADDSLKSSNSNTWNIPTQKAKIILVAYTKHW